MWKVVQIASKNWSKFFIGQQIKKKLLIGNKCFDLTNFFGHSKDISKRKTQCGEPFLKNFFTSVLNIFSSSVYNSEKASQQKGTERCEPFNKLCVKKQNILQIV